MDVPDLVRQSLGDEEIQAGVSLGDDDAICFTPTRSLVYRSEGLLSDEGVSEYAHDFERLAVSEGRRKTKYTMTYVDREEKFTVPGNRTDPVLERLVESNLRIEGVLDDDESVTGVFRFSELTLVVAQQRVLKHVGSYTWDGDFEVYDYDDVTGLHFEDGSVATAVVIEAGGRPERIKAPNEQAGVVRRTLQEALFDYHEVDSLDALNRKIAVETEDPNADESDDHSSGLGLDSGIDPLVSDSDDDEAAESEPEPAAGQSGGGTASTSARERDSSAGQSTQTAASTVDLESAADAASTAAESTAASSDDLDAVTDQLEELTAAVEQQNELLEQQQRTVKQLIEELRRGR
ncbi:hypothetical protein SAMN05216559_1148 [Halomicrobium zhouii]|uniref:DUF7115 domain-containing protein n=1 Tax=Halomicrobium zhouii TaxID=767519 RepID=A0A1I6KNF7_9EURY|nr:hypothetical protein [Halomicrobium zhouii]SFR92779.1 hypothetical protein SAMN05216559_1148 [Halomicrobium zhouii]